MKHKNTHTGAHAPSAGSPRSGLALTPRQKQALSIDRHLSVTANAGSGKTAVLVQRYLRLLLDRKAAVDQIVVLTYTDKAAGELRRRIAAALQEASHRAEPERKELLASVREQLPKAFIGTIHSFCARILREYAIEAGVDADSGVLEGIDQRMAVAGAVAESVSAILQNEAAETLRMQLYSLLGSKGTAWVFRCMSILLEKRDRLGRLTGPGGLYSLDDKKILSRWQKELKEQASRELSDPSLESDLERVCSVAPGALEEFRRARDPGERGIAFLNLTERMFRKDGKLAASFAGSGAAARELAAEGSRIRRRQVALASLLRVLLQPSLAAQSHTVLLAATRALLTATRLAVERYDREKLAAALLDYEDLQLRTRSLLENEEVRAALAERFRFIMVDEFQDTNFLQYELLLPLVSGLRTGNLFIVGDPQQSIYGFRDADPAVFEASRKDILESRDSGAAVVMDESFRPLADIAAFVNLVFSSGMNGGEALQMAPAPGQSRERPRSLSATAFQPLVLARQSESPGRVELLLHQDAPGAPSEAEMIARRIVEMLEPGESVFDPQERPRQLGPGDVAILIRSRAALPELEDALARHSVPYVVTGGIGFFQTQDLLDFYNYFRFLVNPSDSVALAGILRSPFFLVSDSELFEVSLRRGEKALWEFISSPGFPGKEFESTSRAMAILHEDLAVGLRLPPAELIDRIVRETSYVPLVSGDERGKQRLANLEKLRQFARAATGPGFVTHYDFVERLGVLVEREENEGQAEADVPENAVRVMTVHAAKGLEFPVVILPRLDKRFQFDLEPYIDQRLGIGFSLPGQGGTEELSPLTAHLKEESRRKTIDEEKRILYVACTRARDALIVSGEWEDDREKVNALNWVLRGLGIGETFPHGMIERTVDLDRLTASDGASRRLAMQYTLRVRVLTPADLPGGNALARPEAPVRQDAPQLLIGPLRAKSTVEEFTGEMLRTYVECPHRYFERYVLGLPPGAQEEKLRRFDSLVSAVLRRGDLNSLLELVPSAWPGGIPQDFGPQLLVAAAMSMPEGILSDVLPLIYRDGEGVWNVRQFKQGSGSRGAEEYIRESLKFLLELDALLLHRLSGAPEVQASLLFAEEPAGPVLLRSTDAEAKETERKVREIIRSIWDGRFEHRELPCPICEAYGR